jgi:hypothetical protein
MRPNKQIGPTVPQNVGGPVPAFSEDGGRRKGRNMKVKPKENRRGYVTVQQAREILAIDPNAVYDKKMKCVIYRRPE